MSICNCICKYQDLRHKSVSHEFNSIINAVVMIDCVLRLIKPSLLSLFQLMLLKSLISRSQHFLRWAFICKLLFINSFNNTSFKPLNKSSEQTIYQGLWIFMRLKSMSTFTKLKAFQYDVICFKICCYGCYKCSVLLIFPRVACSLITRKHNAKNKCTTSVNEKHNLEVRELIRNSCEINQYDPICPAQYNSQRIFLHF